ncbi:MAG: 3-dehydroquinate synthase [Clostridia bacterium]|nr:3-dehydroquinate synthase [Clostridia bacterium]
MEIKHTLKMELGERSYDITIGSGLLSSAGELFRLDRRVLVVTDSGVPSEYSDRIVSQCAEAKKFVFEAGEGSKNLDTYSEICRAMLDFGLQRRDAVVAVGGGVCGDMAGFAAATYMRGIDFYNVPTTLLSQVDSSIGGKCAVDFCGVKNILGAFYQPRGVLIDTDVLSTLDKRQLASGAAEVIKMSLTSDAELFARLKAGLLFTDIAEAIYSALKIKKSVVEADERENGIRKILNFGHTIGHGIEAVSGLYHGECVALGMIPMSSPEVRRELIPLLSELGLPTEITVKADDIREFMKHDKKGDGRLTSAVFVDKIGSWRIEAVSTDELLRLIG